MEISASGSSTHIQSGTPARARSLSLAREMLHRSRCSRKALANVCKFGRCLTDEQVQGEAPPHAYTASGKWEALAVAQQGVLLGGGARRHGGRRVRVACEIDQAFQGNLPNIDCRDQMSAICTGIALPRDKLAAIHFWEVTLHGSFSEEVSSSDM